MSHRHLVVGPVNWTLDIGWCSCGQEYQVERDRWREPKTYEGKRRRLTWHEEEAE